MVFYIELDVLTTALVLEEYKLKRFFLQCEGGMIDGYQPYPG